MMMPDMTPWSYPKRKTPNDTKIEVKYLGKVSARMCISNCWAAGIDQQ